MSRERAAVLPFLLLAIATLAWLAAGLYYGGDLLAIAGLALLALGACLAAWAARDGARKAPLVAGLALGALGVVLFLGPGLGELGGTGELAGHAFGLGLLLAAIAAQLARDGLTRAAWALAALGALLWIVDDFAGGGSAWQPGNLAAFVACGWIALGHKR